jgi:hypothetical protein
MAHNPTTTVATGIVEDIVDLVRLREGLTSADHRLALARVTRSLRGRVEDGIPKHRAARLLGVSPQALDRHIGMGRIPTVRRPGSSRELVDRDALIRLLVEIAALRDDDRASRPLGRAIRTLERRRELPRRVRLNQSAAELRYECEHSSPANRLRSAASLSHATTRLAAAGRASHARAIGD